MSLLTHSLCALLLSVDPPAPPPRTAIVLQGETLAQLAKRTLNDEAAASEIRALNRLDGSPLQPGAQLRIPGPERAMAQNAVSAASRALSQSDAGTPDRQQASRRLAEAEEHFHQARYAEATRAADAVWELISDSPQPGTQFSVQVNHEGRTQVMTRTGQPVRVEAEGVTQTVYAGQTTVVEKGQPPTRPVEQLPAPSLSTPADQTTFKVKPTRQGLGPVTLTWKAVPGAKGYEVELTVPDGKAPMVVKATRPEAKLPPLPPGQYQWAVRSVADDLKSGLSARRSFELQAEQIKLEVRGAGWK